MKITYRLLVFLVVALVVLALSLLLPVKGVHSEIPTSTITAYTPTMTNTMVSTLTFTAVPTNTAVPTITPLPTNVNCQVPVSIMLHWYDNGILESLLTDIQNSGYVSVTYESAYFYCRSGYDLSKTVILSFDDAGPSNVYSTLQSMIEYTNSRGFTGVIGVVGGDLSEESWQFLQQMKSYGWEIANHSKTHPKEGLPFLSDDALYEDIYYVQNRVFENLGFYPITLILPGGTFNNDSRIIQYSWNLGIKFMVGIGTPFDPQLVGEGPFYVGRVAPWNGTDMSTWTYALRVFQP